MAGCFAFSVPRCQSHGLAPGNGSPNRATKEVSVMGRPGPIEQATQAPGEIRVLPSAYVDVTVAQFKLAQRLIDECNGNAGLALDVLKAVADA